MTAQYLVGNVISIPERGGAGGSGAIVVSENHIFASNAARDSYFATNPDELEEGLYIVVADELQQYRGTTWVVMSSVIRGPSGLPGASTYEIAQNHGFPGTEVEWLQTQVDGELLCAAGADIDPLRIVYELGGQVFELSASDTANVEFLVGLTLNSGSLGGNVRVRRAGYVVDASWSWTRGRIFLGEDGNLTQTPPETGAVVSVGTAMSATKVLLKIDDPIYIN